MKWWQPSPPSSEIKPIPWLSPAVVQHLENLIQPDWNIIEHGSGGSTLWFAARCKSVTSFEHNPDWQKIVKDQTPENASVYSINDAVSLTFSGFDLCLIDGEPVEHRARWIEDAVQLVKPGGWVVLDNANRPEYAKERQHLQAYAAEFQTFDGNEGGTKYLVTEFYRMPEVNQEYIEAINQAMDSAEEFKEKAGEAMAKDLIEKDFKPKPKRSRKGGK